MDFLTFVTTYGEIGAGAIVVGVVLAVFSGVLVPARTHTRELNAANKGADEWREAHRVSEIAHQRLLDQNSSLLAGVRIADRFYRDLIPEASTYAAVTDVAGSDVRS